MPEDAPNCEASPRVGVVIPLFAPGPAFVEALLQLRSEVDAVVLVDDEGGPSALERTSVLEGCVPPGVEVVAHPVNRGIAAALNTGITRLRELGMAGDDCVLTLDQDSRLPPGAVRVLLEGLEAARAADPAVRFAAPARISGLPARDRSADQRRFVEPIQSGLVLPLALLDEVGGFTEDLFIDGVDTELALRCASRGFRCAFVGGFEMGHSLGRPGLPAAGSVVDRVRVSDTTRYYYLARNRVRLVRTFARRQPRWAVASVLGLLRHLAIVTVLAAPRRARLQMVARGLADARAGRWGRLEERPSQVPTDQRPVGG